MTGELEPQLRAALREEAYRPPVALTAAEVLARLDAHRPGGTSRRWFVATATTAGLALVAGVVSFTLIGRPGETAATPSNAVACDASPGTRHGSWWVEIGGPSAFFNIEPGSLWANSDGSTWLVHVRFDPDAASGEPVSIRAEHKNTGRRVDGSLNGRADPGNIFKLDEPAPRLPGGWYLFEQQLPEAGCWRLSAAIDDRVVGTATVAVGPGRPAPSPDPLAPTPRAPTSFVKDGARFNVIGTAADCPSLGGCGYFLELEGNGRRDRVTLSAYPPSDLGPDEPITTYDLELHTPPSSLEPGSYSVTLSSVAYSWPVMIGDRDRETPVATCSMEFVLDAATDGVIVAATFDGSECTASVQFVSLENQPPYELSCGPIEQAQCRERAEGAALAALMHNPGRYVVSITYTSSDGDSDLVLDNGTVISEIVN